MYYASSSTAQPQLSQSIVGTLSLLIWDLLGSNGEIEIRVIITSDVICCIDVPLIITIALVIDKHINPSRVSTSVGHECKTHMGICDWEISCAANNRNTLTYLISHMFIIKYISYDVTSPTLLIKYGTSQLACYFLGHV